MSQRNVEWMIGRLATDEAFRERFAADPDGTLREAVERGVELNPCELHALAAVDPQLLAWFADRLDPRIQKSDLRCPGHGASPSPARTSRGASRAARG